MSNDIRLNSIPMGFLLAILFLMVLFLCLDAFLTDRPKAIVKQCQYFQAFEHNGDVYSCTKKEQTNDKPN